MTILIVGFGKEFIRKAAYPHPFPLPARERVLKNLPRHLPRVLLKTLQPVCDKINIR
jgi:hypothetical protein